jgi:nucleoside-diphosphate kinase
MVPSKWCVRGDHLLRRTPHDAYEAHISTHAHTGVLPDCLPALLLWQYDLKNRRTFLKRCDYPAVTAKDLYKGGIITIYSRQLTIVDYGDEYTRKIFDGSSASTTVRVAPAALPSMGRIIDAVCASALTISELRLLPDGLCLKLTGSNTADACAALLPQINSELGEGAVSAIDDCFAAQLPKPVVGDPSTCSLLLVRAHAVKAGVLGRIIDQVLGSGFEVVNAQMTMLTRPNAGEFLEVYKGVVPECVDWVEELVSGKTVALQLRFTAKPEATVLALRELCGAHDPEIAQHLHPNSLRALYGASKVKNAVHCTDLPEDGPLEVDYFFSSKLASPCSNTPPHPRHTPPQSKLPRSCIIHSLSVAPFFFSPAVL